MIKLFTILNLIVLIFSCKNDDYNILDPLNQLPPITTTGENTIGCLVNGEPFTDSGLMNNFYQFIDGEYFLAINWSRGFSNDFEDGSISIRRIEIIEGETYLLDMNSIQNDFTGGSGGYVLLMTQNRGSMRQIQVFLAL